MPDDTRAPVRGLTQELLAQADEYERFAERAGRVLGPYYIDLARSLRRRAALLAAPTIPNTGLRVSTRPHPVRRVPALSRRVRPRPLRRPASAHRR